MISMTSKQPSMTQENTKWLVDLDRPRQVREGFVMGVPAISLFLIICGIHVLTEIRGLPVDDRIYYNSEEDRNHGVKHDLFHEWNNSSNDSGKESSGNSIEGLIWHHSITGQGKKSRVKSSTDKVWKSRMNIGYSGSSNNGENMPEHNCKEYLYEYGYLQERDMADNKAIRDALLMYQKFVGINASLECDVKTKAEMTRPRCGFTGMIENHASENTRRIKRYAIDSGLRWYKNTLTYWYENFTPDLSEAEVRNQIEQAFKVWADVTPLTFCEVSSGTLADMEIQFAAGDHEDDYPFDGPGGSLTHAFFPVNKGLDQNTIAGHVHFDEDENWSTSDKGINLLQIAAHSFGHALGLYHSNISGALMSPLYNYNPSFSLQSDDIAAIQALYGAPSGSKEDRIRFNLLKLTITGSALTQSVVNMACTEINDFLLTTGLYDPVSCTPGTSSSGKVYSASLRISLDTSASNAAMLTTAVLNAAVPASSFISGVTTSTFAATSSTCSSQYKTMCDKGRANCIPLADGYACQCPRGMVNIGTTPDVFCASTRDGEVSFAYMRDVQLVITGSAASSTDPRGLLNHVCSDVVGPILEEYFIDYKSCNLIIPGGTGGTTYIARLHMTSWIPLKTTDLNLIVTTAKLSTGITLFSVRNSQFSDTAVSCTTEQTAACYAQTGADCLPIAGGYYCQCPDGQIDVGYKGQLNCILSTSCLQTIGKTPSKPTKAPKTTPSQESPGTITMSPSIPPEDGNESTPGQGLSPDISIGTGAGIGGLLLIGLIIVGIVLCCKQQRHNKEASTKGDGSRDAARWPALDITNPAFSPDVEPGRTNGRDHNHQRNHNNPRGNQNNPGRDQSNPSNQPSGQSYQGLVRETQARSYQDLHPGYEHPYEDVESNSADYISVRDSSYDQMRSNGVVNTYENDQSHDQWDAIHQQILGGYNYAYDHMIHSEGRPGHRDHPPQTPVR